MFCSVLLSTIFNFCLIIVLFSHTYATSTTKSDINAPIDPRLSTVYDAMKVNYQKSLRHNLNKLHVLSDVRNKRNINERSIPQHADTYRSVDGWLTGSGDAAIHLPDAQGTDLVCTTPQHSRDTHGEVDPHYSTLSITDHNPLKPMNIIKYGLIGMGLLSLPFIVFKMLIIPVKILMGLKALSMANSVLLATLLYKYVTQQQQIDVIQSTNENVNHESMVPMMNSEEMTSVNGASVEENAKRILQMIHNKNNKW